MALGTGGWFPHGPGHDVEARHKNNIPRGLEADDALLLAFVLDGSASFFLGDLRGAASTPSTRRLDDFDDAVAVVEAHEDALALKPSYFPTLAIERAGA